jgi:serine/threonine protein kinase
VSRQFGRYRVIKPLGAGAMGAVYLASDDILGREVAVKTVRTLGLSGFAREQFHARFLNEARAIASLSHANVVRVFDVGIEGDTPFLIMEVVGGRSLRDLLDERGTIDADLVRALGVQIARALEAAHARGVVHRDVKPANLLCDERGVWKLADFGVAHVPDSSITITGQFLGSPAYAAPEALSEGAANPACDVYALGATLCEAITGKTPRDGANVASAPADLAAAIGAALARDPRQRPTAGQLAEGLASTSDRPAPPVPFWTRRRKIIAAIVALGVAILGIAVAVSGGDGDDARDDHPHHDERHWQKIWKPHKKDRHPHEDPPPPDEQ